MIILGFLFTLGLVAVLLLGEIRRVHRQMAESIQAHHQAISKIPELEAQIRHLTKKVEALQ